MSPVWQGGPSSSTTTPAMRIDGRSSAATCSTSSPSRGSTPVKRATAKYRILASSRMVSPPATFQHRRDLDRVVPVEQVQAQHGLIARRQPADRRFERAQVGCLYGVLGVLPVATQVQRDAAKRRRRAIKHLAERVDVATASVPFEQRFEIVLHAPSMHGTWARHCSELGNRRQNWGVTWQQHALLTMPGRNRSVATLIEFVLRRSGPS